MKQINISDLIALAPNPLSIPETLPINSPKIPGFSELSNDTVNLLSAFVDEYFARCAILGLHLIGYYDDDITDSDASTYAKYIFYNSIIHYIPQLKVLDGLFMKLVPEWKTTHENSGKARTTGGSEDSPITSATLEPVADATDWELTNPIAKYGNKSESSTTGSETKVDPELALRIQNLSIDGLNIVVITDLICRRCISEYNKIY